MMFVVFIVVLLRVNVSCFEDITYVCIHIIYKYTYMCSWLQSFSSIHNSAMFKIPVDDCRILWGLCPIYWGSAIMIHEHRIHIDQPLYNGHGQ